MPQTFQVAPFRFGRGLNLVAAPEVMGEGQTRVLQNFNTLGSGRITTRKAIGPFAFFDGQPVLYILPFAAEPGVAALVFTFEADGAPGAGDSIFGTVNLWTVDGNARKTLKGALAGWEHVDINVRIHATQINSIAFICDEDQQHGLTVYDPLDHLGGLTRLFQPTFSFAGGDPTAALPSFVMEHLNHLCMFGYGDELDPLKPDVWRFSYLGLIPDDHGEGDAGEGGVTGSAGIFDKEDRLNVLTAGERIIGASSAPGRLLILSEREAHVIYGQDFESWRRDKIDSERGLTNSYALGEADGAAWWHSPLGFCRYRGGGSVEDMTERPDGGSVRPVLEQIDGGSVLFAHAWDLQQVRFLYREKGDERVGADRVLIYDYRADTWLTHLHSLKAGDRIRCTGYLRPSGLEKPGAPSQGLRHTDITSTSATALWVPGDQTPGTRTIVRLAQGSGGFQQVANLAAGVSRFQHAGLTPATAYATEIEEIRNGSSLGTVRASFTTLAATVSGYPAPVLPSNLRARDGSYWSASKDPAFYGRAVLVTEIELRWDWVVGGMTLLIERTQNADGTGFLQIATSADSLYLDVDVAALGTYYYRVKARNAAGDLSDYSDTFSATRNPPVLPPPPDDDDDGPWVDDGVFDDGDGSDEELF